MGAFPPWCEFEGRGVGGHLSPPRARLRLLGFGDEPQAVHGVREDVWGSPSLF